MIFSVDVQRNKCRSCFIKNRENKNKEPKKIIALKISFDCNNQISNKGNSFMPCKDDLKESY